MIWYYQWKSSTNWSHAVRTCTHHIYTCRYTCTCTYVFIHYVISLDEPSDSRLAVVMEFHRTEDAYLEHLRNIFDVYMEPLRYMTSIYMYMYVYMVPIIHSMWGISQSDMNTLFLPLSRLCDLLMNFFSEVSYIKFIYLHWHWWWIILFHILAWISS